MSPFPKPTILSQSFPPNLLLDPHPIFPINILLVSDLPLEFCLLNIIWHHCSAHFIQFLEHFPTPTPSATLMYRGSPSSPKPQVYIIRPDLNILSIVCQSLEHHHAKIRSTNVLIPPPVPTLPSPSLKTTKYLSPNSDVSSLA